MDNPQWFPDSQREQRRTANGQPSRDYPSPLSISAAGHASASAVPPVAAASSSSSRAASAYSFDQFQQSQHHQLQHQHQHQQHHQQPHSQLSQLPPQLPHPLQPGAHTSSGSLHAVSSPLARDTSGDIAMHDAHDAHAGIKYPMRPHHQSHLSGTARSSGLYSPQDQQPLQQQQQQQQHQQPPPLQHHHSHSGSQSQIQSQPSSAAQRYSPMDTLSPTSPYASSKPHFTSSPSQHTPPNAGDYSQSSYYATRGQGPPQLPPIAPYTTLDGYPSSAVAALDGAFNDAKAPRRQNPPAMRTVPEFKKIKSPNELQPKNTRQPRFRRANPEGGFISVSFFPLLHSMSWSSNISLRYC